MHNVFYIINIYIIHKLAFIPYGQKTENKDYHVILWRSTAETD